MKKLIPLLLMCLLFIGVGNTQAQTAEQPVGFKVFFGLQSYNGDLGNELLEYDDTDFLYGLGLEFYLNDYWDLSLDAQYMTLDKQNGPNDSVVSKRNTSFASSIFNTNLMLRFKPFETRLNPYLAAGIGGSYVTDKDDVKKDDSQFIFSIPFGVGVNYSLSDHTSLNVQVIYNRTFNDEIDNYPLDNSDVTTYAQNNGDSRGYDRNIDGIDHDDFLTSTIGLVFNFGGGESEEESLEKRLLEQSMKTLQAAQNSSNEASNTLRQAQQLNDETLAALDSLRNAMSQSKQESQDLKARMVHIVNNIQFEFDKSDIIDPAHDELNSLADILQNYQNLNIDISGYADERGSDSYNQKLSERRAQAVKDYLVNQGVNTSRITTNAYGEDRQQMSGNSATAYAQNRSVRVTLSYNDNGMMNDNSMDNDSMMNEDDDGSMNN